mgnify:CR=1 FL=1
MSKHQDAVHKRARVRTHSLRRVGTHSHEGAYTLSRGWVHTLSVRSYEGSTSLYKDPPNRLSLELVLISLDRLCA